MLKIGCKRYRVCPVLDTLKMRYFQENTTEVALGTLLARGFSDYNCWTLLFKTEQ